MHNESFSFVQPEVIKPPFREERDKLTDDLVLIGQTLLSIEESQKPGLPVLIDDDTRVMLIRTINLLEYHLKTTLRALPENRFLVDLLSGEKPNFPKAHISPLDLSVVVFNEQLLKLSDDISGVNSINSAPIAQPGIITGLLDMIVEPALLGRLKLPVACVDFIRNRQTNSIDGEVKI